MNGNSSTKLEHCCPKTKLLCRSLEPFKCCLSQDLWWISYDTLSLIMSWYVSCFTLTFLYLHWKWPSGMSCLHLLHVWMLGPDSKTGCHRSGEQRYTAGLSFIHPGLASWEKVSPRSSANQNIVALESAWPLHIIENLRFWLYICWSSRLSFCVAQWKSLRSRRGKARGFQLSAIQAHQHGALSKIMWTCWNNRTDWDRDRIMQIMQTVYLRSAPKASIMVKLNPMSSSCQGRSMLASWHVAKPAPPKGLRDVSILNLAQCLTCRFIWKVMRGESKSKTK